MELELLNTDTTIIDILKIASEFKDLFEDSLSGYEFKVHSFSQRDIPPWKIVSFELENETADETLEVSYKKRRNVK